MKDQLIDKALLRRISPILTYPFIMKCIMKIGGLDKVNRVYNSAKHLTGTDIEDAMINEVGIIRCVHNIDVLRQFNKQSFITVSNHPFGHLDGIMLIGETAKIRPDYKMMVNWMLKQVDIMQDHFIGVNPFSSDIVNKSSFGGVRECILHLNENHPLGFFPAGSVSKNIGRGRAKDREWQPGVIKLIQKAQVPVIPVFISGQNSQLFNFLDHFNWWVRNIRLCHELYTKKGKTVHLVFGEPILPEQQKEISNTKMFGDFLKEQTYALGTNLLLYD